LGSTRFHVSSYIPKKAVNKKNKAFSFHFIQILKIKKSGSTWSKEEKFFF